MIATGVTGAAAGARKRRSSSSPLTSGITRSRSTASKVVVSAAGPLDYPQAAGDVIQPCLHREETLVGHLLGVAKALEKDFEPSDAAFKLERFDGTELGGDVTGPVDG
jgi:hypothetical protein